MSFFTIAIPTYNRREKLEKMLKELVNQIKDEYDIEVLISDNCSTDGTNELCEIYEKKYNYIKYHRFDHNTGFDGNFHYLFSNANSTYVQIMSDDDMYLNGAVPYIYRFLVKHKDMNACFVNNVSFDGEYIDLEHCYNKQIKEYDVSKVVDKTEFLEKVNLGFSYVSSMIFNKRYFDGRNLLDYYGTSWMSAYIFIGCSTNSNDRYGIIGRPLIGYRVTKGLFGYDYYTVFGPNRKKMIYTGIKEANFSKKIVLDQYRRECRHVVSNISKEKILHNKDLFTRFYPFFKATIEFPSMWPIFLTLFIPGGLWKIIRKAFGKRIVFDD